MSTTPARPRPWPDRACSAAVDALIYAGIALVWAAGLARSAAGTARTGAYLARHTRARRIR